MGNLKESEGAPLRSPPPPLPSKVLAYGDRQAVLWFALLVLRNADKLAPVYGFAAAFAGSAGVLTYWAILEFAKS